MKRIVDLGNNVNDHERYSHRWCVHMNRVSEWSTENIKARVKEWRKVVFDVVHRHGRLKSGDENVKNARFISRTTRDLTWRHAIESEYLKRNSLHSKEDPTSFDEQVGSGQRWRRAYIDRNDNKRCKMRTSLMAVNCLRTH